MQGQSGLYIENLSQKKGGGVGLFVFFKRGLNSKVHALYISAKFILYYIESG